MPQPPCKIPHRSSGWENEFPFRTIGFGYKAKVGKGLAAELTCKMLENAGIPVVRASFADGVYATAEFMIGRRINRAQKRPDERVLLQKLGTDVGRDFDDSIWVDWLRRTVPMGNRPLDTVVVIDDCRFQNEVNFVKEHGHAFAIHRVNNWSPLEGEAGDHPSETTGSNITWCGHILNPGDDIEAFKFLIESALHEYGLLP